VLCRRLTPLWLLAAAALLAGCAVLRPVGELEVSRIETEWARPLYALEMFAYRPVEAGEARFVKGGAAPEHGMVVVPSRDRVVRAVDAVTGQELWRLATEGANVAPAVVVGEDLLVGSMDGRLYRAHQRNGRPVWTVDFPGRGAVVTPPVVSDGVAYAASIENRVAAFRLSDGAVLWDQRRPHQGEFTITGQSGLAVHGAAVIAGFSDGRLIAFDKADGATRWSVDLSGGAREFIDVDTTPLVIGDVIVAGCYSVGLFGLDAATGKVLWRVGGEGYGTPAALEGTLYVPQSKGRLLAVDAATGAVRWATRLSTGSPATPAVSRKYLLVATGDALLIIDRGSGRTLVRLRDERGFSATPEVAWGTVYALANSGILYALALY
jgi:outer membrane protein assembly factor BamB